MVSLKLPENLIFIGGSTCAGKTTAINNSSFVLPVRYDKTNQELRPFHFVSAVYRAIALAHENPDKIYVLDRAPLDYFVWSHKIRAIEGIYPLSEWSFIKTTLKNTILVYNENEECALSQRNITAEQYRDSQEFYQHYAFTKPYLFKEVVHGFLSPEILDKIVKR